MVIVPSSYHVKSSCPKPVLYIYSHSFLRHYSSYHQQTLNKMVDLFTANTNTLQIFTSIPENTKTNYLLSWFDWNDGHKGWPPQKKGIANRYTTKKGIANRYSWHSSQIHLILITGNWNNMYGQCRNRSDKRVKRIYCY